MASAPILLGIAGRVIPPDAVSPGAPQTIYDLRQVVGSFIYPLDLRNWSFVFAFPNDLTAGTLRFCGSPDVELWKVQFQLHGSEGKPGSASHYVLPVRIDDHALLWRPTALGVRFVPEDGTAEVDLGALEFLYERPAPMSEEFRNAIESHPGSLRFVRMDLGCPTCGDEMSPVAGLERWDDPEGRAVWYEDLPDEFKCQCGKMVVPLRYLRDGMHLLLWHLAFLPDGTISTTRTVSLDDVERVLRDFYRLLEEEPAEEAVQKYIGQNKLLLAPFGAARLFVKPPILTEYRADFAIVNSRKELILIEIERPSMPILRQDGNRTSELTAAIGQPDAWAQVVAEHRAAVLRGIKGCPADISRVRYVVVAGRSGGCDPTHLARLTQSTGQVEFMTYDQLAESVRAAFRSAIS